MNIQTNTKIPLLLKIIFIFIAMFLCFLNTKKAFAQSNDDVSLTVLPPLTYLHVAPGTSGLHTVVLENTGLFDIIVTPKIVDFTTNGKSNQVIPTNELTFPYFSAKNLEVIRIPAGKKAQLTLTLNVPQGAQEREYPMSILFFSQADTQNNQAENANNTQKIESVSQINAALASNLIVLVAKQNTFEKVFSLSEFNSKKIIDSFSPLEFTAVVKNNSLGAAVASGSATVLNWQKKPVAEFEIYPDIVLGHNSRELRALFIDQPDTFSYKPKFLLGPYQIQIKLTAENNAVLLQETHVVYAIPLLLILTILSGISMWLYFNWEKLKKTE